MLNIDKNSGFKELVSKEEITYVIFINSDANKLKFVTTSSDGFIKMNEVDIITNKLTCSKSLFVCQSGISTVCQLSGE